MSINAAEAYLENKIKTASQVELTLILYEGIIKFCNIAIMAMEENNIEKAHTNLTKAQRIIEELQITLNHDYGVSENFVQIYDYIYYRLTEANLQKDKEIVEEVLEHARGLRDMWKEVIKQRK